MQFIQLVMGPIMFDSPWNPFNTQGFVPRWNCGQWSTLHGWTHIISDVAIFGAYVTIPAIIAFFVLRRRDIPFRPIFWCFFLFIISCGTTHLMEALIFGWPAYRLAAVLKMITAIVSWGTVVALCWVVPQALALRSPNELEAEVAQRRQAEEALRRSEERFRNAFEYAAVGMAVITPNGRFLQVNPAFCALTGYTAGELPNHELRELIVLDDYLALNEQLAALRAGQTPFFHAEVRGINSVGQSFWAQLAVSMAPGEPGQSAVCLLQAQDITKRREAQQQLEVNEERLRHLFTHNPVAVYEIDFEPLDSWVRKGIEHGETDFEVYRQRSWAELSAVVSKIHLKDANPAAIELFEANSKEQLVDQFANVFDGKSAKESYDAELDAFWNRRSRVSIERSGKTLGGRQIHCVLNWTASTKPEDFRRTIVAVTDITERKRLEEKVLQAQKLESLGVLAGGVAHDFNNLLMGILGNADLALMDLSPASPGREFVANIRAAALRAADLCKQMLAYSGKGRFVVQTLNLADLVEEMGHLLDVAISKKATLRHHFSPDAPPVEGDATQLRQVIMNLITNASDALAEKNGIVNVSVSRAVVDENYLAGTYYDDQLPAGEYTVLEVSDTGCGMSEEDQKRIFDPFFSTKFTGRGLGLAAVLGIVRGHRGAINVYSQLGKGTTIKILLPSSRQTIAVAEPEPVAPSAWRASGVVLLVDDDDTARGVAESIMTRLGFTVLQAKNGVEAVEMFARHAHEIRLVVLDMTMPRLGGEETFRELRRIQPDVRVLLTSGYNELEATTRLAGKGLAGFIQKPYGSTQLLAKVRQILEDPEPSI